MLTPTHTHTRTQQCEGLGHYISPSKSAIDACYKSEVFGALGVGPVESGFWVVWESLEREMRVWLEEGDVERGGDDFFIVAGGDDDDGEYDILGGGGGQTEGGEDYDDAQSYSSSLEDEVRNELREEINCQHYELFPAYPNLIVNTAFHTAVLSEALCLGLGQSAGVPRRCGGGCLEVRPDSIHPAARGYHLPPP